MTYLIIEMVALLLAAMLIGLIIGWMIERWLRYQEIETLRQALRNTRLSYEQNERLLRHRVAELTHVAQSFKAQLLDAGIQPALPMPADIRDDERDEKESPIISTGAAATTQSATAQQSGRETVIIAEEDTSSDTSAHQEPAQQAEQAAHETDAAPQTASDSGTMTQKETEQAAQAEEPEEPEAKEADTKAEDLSSSAREQKASDVQEEASETSQEAPSTTQANATSTEEDGSSSATEEEAGYPVQEVEGIGPVYSKRLGEKGIRTTTELIEKTASDEAAADIAKHVKVSVTVLQRWVNMSQLMKVPGIQGQYAKLLELAEIHNCDDLARQSARSLTRKLRVVNELHHITQHPPKESEVRSWIQYAKTRQQS